MGNDEFQTNVKPEQTNLSTRSVRLQLMAGSAPDLQKFSLSLSLSLCFSDRKQTEFSGGLRIPAPSFILVSKQGKLLIYAHEFLTEWVYYRIH